MNKPTINLKDLDDLLCKYQVKDLGDLENRLKAESEKQSIRDYYIKRYEEKLKAYDKENNQLKRALNGEIFINYKIPMENAHLKQQLAELNKEPLNCSQLENGMSLCVIQKSRIKELGAKLAKSEKSNEYFADRVEKADKEIKENYRNYNKLVEEYNKLVEECNKLKQQLAEKDKSIQAYEKIVEQKDEEISFAKRDKTCIVKQLNDPKDYVLLEDYKKVEKQLVEKDAENKKLSLLYFGDENTEIVLTTDKMINHIKILFAVEQLEKVKELCIKDMTICEDYFAIEKILDNQIKAIKEGK